MIDSTLLILEEIENVLADNSVLVDKAHVVTPFNAKSLIREYLTEHDLVIAKRSEIDKQLREAYEEVERARNEAETWKRVSYQSDRKAGEKYRLALAILDKQENNDRMRPGSLGDVT